MEILKGKVAIVTGGTRGIGYSTVLAYLQQGAKVALCGSRQETVDKALENLRKVNPDFPVMGMCPDLTDVEAVKEAFKQVNDKWGRIDILVNNAGISQNTPITKYTEKEIDQVLDINIKSVFLCAQAAVEYMRPQQSGVILNTSSVVSLYGQTTGCGYPASKCAVNGLTKSLARELGRDGIRVNAIAPGVIATDMVSALAEDVVARISKAIPLGRVGQPEDIANAFLFLASDMAAYITGAVLSVDGAAMM